MSEARTVKPATYADLEAVAPIQRGEEVRVAPFDAVGFPIDDLFPFDAPRATEG